MTAFDSRRAFLAAVGATVGLAGVGTAAGTPTADDASTDTSVTSSETSPTSTANQRTTTGTPPAPVGDHPMFGVDPARTGYDPDDSGPVGPVKSQWCVGSGGSNRLTSLAVVGGTVFSGSPSEGLRTFDTATGRTQWRATFESYPGDPTVAGDRVYTTDGRSVYGLGVESGRELWSTTPEVQITTSVLVDEPTRPDDATVFVAVSERNDSGEEVGAAVHALDAGDGATRWTAPIDGGTLYRSLAARDGIVYGGGGNSSSFYAFDAASGERIWRAELGEHASSPAVGPESVFVGDESGTVHARDRRDGSARWTYEVGTDVRTSPAVADGTVYVAATDGNLYALDAETGDLAWRFDGGRRLTCSPTVAAGGEDGSAVYVGSEQGNVFAVDTATGDRRWSFQLSDRVETAPVVVDGTVFVGDGEGRLYRLVDESVPTPDGGRTCRTPRSETPTRTDPTGDTDGDGAADEHDYAPRDASVQQRSDLATDDGDGDPGFFAGIGVGTAVSVAGVSSGWWLRSRGDGAPDDDGE